ncbi:MAG TPA: hypothetical protein VGL81_07805 [Polyangiaceae bacterium]
MAGQRSQNDPKAVAQLLVAARSAAAQFAAALAALPEAHREVFEAELELAGATTAPAVGPAVEAKPTGRRKWTRRTTHLRLGQVTLCGLDAGPDVTTKDARNYSAVAHRDNIVFCEECVAKLEDALRAKGSPVPVPEIAPTGKRTHAAEAYVLKHPGCTTEAVAKHIGQRHDTAGATLRYLRNSRHSVERREDDLWYPAKKVKPRAMTYEQAVLRAVTEAGGRPIAAGEVFERVRKIRPSSTYPCVAAAVSRLCLTTKQIASTEKNERGEKLYTLPSGGAEPAATVH